MDEMGELADPQNAVKNVASPWKFSLAGVGLKFSMLRNGDRLTLPAGNQLGDWIVKFPDAVYRDVPTNEFATMSLARTVGIDCPATELIHRDQLPPVSEALWPGREELAYAVARFDRAPDGQRVHIEDLAQVRGIYSDLKYQGSFETVAGLFYRGHDDGSLREFVRRLAFNLLIGNGDAHLKNWSLIYRDGRRPRISPAYDIVSTAGYYEPSRPDDIGLKFGGNKWPHRVSRSHFERLPALLNAKHGDVINVLDETIERVRLAWDGSARDAFPDQARLWIDQNLEQTTNRLRRRFTL
jgi:serine/threonine-protein kinase HipA